MRLLVGFAAAFGIVGLAIMVVIENVSIDHNSMPGLMLSPTSTAAPALTPTPSSLTPTRVLAATTTPYVVTTVKPALVATATPVVPTSAVPTTTTMTTTTTVASVATAGTPGSATTTTEVSTSPATTNGEK